MKIIWQAWLTEVWRGPDTKVWHILAFVLLFVPNMLLMLLGLLMYKKCKSVGVFVHAGRDYEVTYFYWWCDFLGMKIDLFRVLGDGYEINRELVQEA